LIINQEFLKINEKVLGYINGIYYLYYVLKDKRYEHYKI
jgi:hypothetical protein